MLLIYYAYTINVGVTVFKYSIIYKYIFMNKHFVFICLFI